jgi:hypothetical protein
MVRWTPPLGNYWWGCAAASIFFLSILEVVSDMPMLHWELEVWLVAIVLIAGVFYLVIRKGPWGDEGTAEWAWQVR